MFHLFVKYNHSTNNRNIRQTCGLAQVSAADRALVRGARFARNSERRQTAPTLSILLTSHDDTAIQVANTPQANTIGPEP